ncbi:MAG: hypothetical protein ACYCX4_13890 [Bacillota bacterium]
MMNGNRSTTTKGLILILIGSFFLLANLGIAGLHPGCMTGFFPDLFLSPFFHRTEPK